MTKKISLSTKVLIGVFTGIFFGLLLGERVGWFSVIGNVFIGLLQMTVLPYIMFSLMVNIGRLSFDTGKKLIKSGLIFLALLIAIGLLFLTILPFAFPDWGSGSFYSSDFVQQQIPFDFVKLYIPANPFFSLSNNIVPAVVLFSIFVGLGLMKLPNKEILLKPLDVMTSGLNQINKMIVKITPIGVFSIATGVVSKLSWSDLSRLQGYLLVYLLAVIILTFIVLPYLISIFTPYSAKTVFKITYSTLITIFATGKIIVVFPQLIENIKQIIESEEHKSEQAKNEVDILLPLAYPFPNLGTLLIFIFVPFAAWYTGHTLTNGDYPLFLSSTLLSSFVAPITGLPFSLDLLDIPKETFELFVVSTVLTDRIRVVLGAFHLITLTLLTISASGGFLKFKKRKFIEGVIIISVTSFVSIFGMKALLNNSMSSIPSNEEMFNSFKIISKQTEYRVLEKASRNPKFLWKKENVLSRIKRCGTIRIGFYKNAMPFSFFNKDSVLVGYGIDLAFQLANDLGVNIDFVPINKGELIQGLKHDYFDIVMSDIFTSSKYAEEIELSKPYLGVSLALLVAKDNNNFNNFEEASKLDTFTISYIERTEIAKEFLSYLPNGGYYKVRNIQEFFYRENLDTIKIDAHLTSAERAAAITVFKPNYKVVNPLPYHINNNLVFPLLTDNVWKRYIDNWIDFRKQDGTFDRIYKQWILGQEYKKKQKAWNIYDNVIKKNHAE